MSMMPCTCLPRSPDDQCPTHGYEAYVRARKESDGLPTADNFGGYEVTQVVVDEEKEWLSQCCGAPPHELTPNVGEDNPAGICGQCKEHTGFERAKL